MLAFMANFAAINTLSECSSGFSSLYQGSAFL